ncbi:hypothetical protein [Staphylococcus phage PMBT8]|nr:hypothetical protein [Staphylococcus phage PMBT8]
MSIKDEYYVKKVERKEIKEFIEKHHYSHNINGCIADYCFGLYLKSTNILVGAMFYGKMAMANQYKKYGEQHEVIELRRLVLVDDTPKNTESFFIGWSLRWLKKNTDIKTIVSYADPNYGHSGVIYKATNFKHVGMTSPGRVIIYNGKKYHDKTIRTKYKGRLKPFAKKVKEALKSGDAYYKKQLPKHIYVKKL